MTNTTPSMQTERAAPIDPPILYWGTPVVLISTLNPDGSTNLAPMSSAWWLGWGCILGMTESAQTVQNLKSTGESVLNLPSSDMAEAVDNIAKTTGAFPIPADKQWLGFQYEGRKFERLGLTPELSVMIAPPRVIECPVQMETTVERISPFDATNPKVRTSIVSIELKVIAVHAHPGIRMEGHANRIDPDRWNPLIMNFR
jgi:flavin reductase (DIM6/NTAB) family NADH-FMN oxidoreductase RutF